MLFETGILFFLGKNLRGSLEASFKSKASQFMLRIDSSISKQAEGGKSFVVVARKFQQTEEK